MTLNMGAGGKQTLVAGQINYTGATAIDAGELVLSGTTAYKSPTTVENGATQSWTHTTNLQNNQGGATTLLKDGSTFQNLNPNNWLVLNGAAVTVDTGADVTINHTANATAAAGRGTYLDAGLKSTGADDTATVTINTINAGSGVNFRDNDTTFAGTMIVNGIASATAFSGSGVGVGGNTTGLQDADIELNGTMELKGSNPGSGIGWANGGGAASTFQMGALSGSGIMVGNYSAGGTAAVTLGNTGNGGTFSGQIVNGVGNTVNIVKEGAGTQAFSGANTYTGGTLVNAGILDLVGNNRILGALTVDGSGIAKLSATGNNAMNITSLTMQNGGTFTDDSPANLVHTVSAAVTFNNGGTMTSEAGATGNGTFGNYVFNGPGINVTGTGLATISATAMSFGFDETVTVADTVAGAGTDLLISSIIRDVWAGTVTKAGAGTLTMTGVNTDSDPWAITAGTLEVGGAGQLQSGSYAGTIANSGTFEYNSTAAQTLSGVISGTGDLIKTNTSTLTLSALNTYTGATTVAAGILKLDRASAAFDTGVIPSSLPINVNNGATLEVAQNWNTIQANEVDLNGGTLNFTSGSATDANTYLNTITLNDGAQMIGNPVRMGYQSDASITVGGSSASTISSGVMLVNEANGTPQRTVTMDVPDVTSDANSDLLVSGVLSDHPAPYGGATLRKTGVGTLTLSGANTYTGTTDVDAGTLSLGGSGSIASSSLTTVKSGAKLTGTGTTGHLTINSGGTNAPGLSPGITTVSGNYTNSGTLEIEIDIAFSGGSPTAGTDHDQVDVTGTVTLGGSSILNVLEYGTGSFAPDLGTEFIIISNGSAMAVTGTFNGLAEGAVAATINTVDLKISYVGGDGNDVVLVAGVGPTSELFVDDEFSGFAVDGNKERLSTQLAYYNIDAFTTTDEAFDSLSSPPFTGILTLNGNSTSYDTVNLDHTDAGNVTLNLVADLIELNNDVTVGTLTGSAGDVVALDSENSGTGNGGLIVSNGTFAGIISGLGDLTKVGAGTLTLSGNNSYSGLTTVNDGTLVLTVASALSAGNYEINNDAFLQTTVGINIGGKTFTFGDGGSGSIAFNGGNHRVNGTTFVTTGGPTNYISGSLLDLGTPTYNVADGPDDVDLQVGNSHNRGGITKNGSGTLRLTSTFNNLQSNPVDINAGTLELGEGGRLVVGNYLGNITNDGIFKHNSTSDQILSGVISGTGSIVKDNTSTLTLSGNNTFSGNVTVDAGTVKIGDDTALGAANTAVTKVTVGSGGTVDFNGVIDATYGYTIAGTGVGSTGALVNNGGTIAINKRQCSNITLSNDASIGGTGEWSLLASGYGATTLDLAGFTLTKSGANRIHIVNSTVTAGSLQIDAGIFSQTSNNKPAGHDLSSVDVTLANTAGAILDLNTTDLSVGSLAGGGGTGGNVTLGTGTLTVGDLDTSTTYAGVISETGGLTKVGTGTLTLSGLNTFSGDTTISNGVLVYNGTNTASTVTNNFGATLKGSGAIGQYIGPGTISPGQSPGSLSVTSLTLSAGGEYHWEITNANGSAGTDWDLISVDASGIGDGTVAIDATSANTYTVRVDSTSMSESDFDNTRDYTWAIIDAGTVITFATDKFTLDTSGFTNDVGSGFFAIAEVNSNIVLRFSSTTTATYEWDAGGGTANDTEREWQFGGAGNEWNWTGDTEPANCVDTWVNGGYTAVVAQVGGLAGNLYVGSANAPTTGDNPTGTVRQIGGDLTLCTNLVLGDTAGSLGTYIITNGSLTVSNNAYVGNSGEGHFSMDGTNAVLSVSGNINVATGAGTSGTFTQHAGQVTANLVNIGSTSSGATGTYVLAGGDLTSATTIHVGTRHHGYFTMDGPDANLNVGGNLFVGSDFVGSGQIGLFTHNAGTSTVSGALQMGYGSGSATYTMTGGVASVGGLTLTWFSGTSTLAIAGSGVMTNSGATSIVGNRLGQGVITLSNDAVMNNAGSFVLGRQVGADHSVGNRISVYDNASFTAGGSVALADGGDATGPDAALEVYGGTVDIDGSLIVSYAAFDYWSSGTGTVFQGGGDVDVGDLYIGYAGNVTRHGYYTITNGSLNSAGSLYLGTSGGSGASLFHVVGTNASITVGDVWTNRGNSVETKFTFNEDFISPIVVSNNIELNGLGTISVTNTAPLADGVYTLMTSVNGRVNGTFNTETLTGLPAGSHIEYIDNDALGDYRVVLVVADAADITFEWDADGGTSSDAARDWSYLFNWTGDTEPAACVNTWVNGGYTAVVAQVGELAGNLYIGSANAPTTGGNPIGSVLQTEGALTLCTNLVLGDTAGSLGTYRLQDGAVAASNHIYVGDSGVGQLSIEGSDYRAKVEALNPVAYYTMDSDDITGSTVNNRGSLTSNTATLQDSATFTGASGGFIGGGLNVDDDTSQRLSVDGGVIDLATEWTVSAWFKDLHPSTYWRTLTRGSNAGGSDHQIIVGYTGANDDELGTFDNVPAGFFGSGYDLAAGDDRWHHLAAVNTGGEGGTVDFYIDGVFVGQSANGSDTDIDDIGGYSADSQPFAQTIDEFAVFSNALTAAQVASLAGPQVSAGGNLIIANGANSSGSVTQHDGVVNVDGAIRLPGLASDESSGTYTMTGGIAYANGGLRVGLYQRSQHGHGHVDHRGQRVMTNGAHAYIGNETGQGLVTLSNNAVLGNSSNFYIGRQVSSHSSIGNTVSLYDNASLTVGGQMRLGDSGTSADGTLNLYGGSVNIEGQIVVGAGGTGTVLQAGGDMDVGTTLWIGNDASRHGFYTVTNGTLTVGNDLVLGSTAGTGTGVFHVVGTNAGITIGNIYTNQGSASETKFSFHEDAISPIVVSNNIELNGLGTLTVDHPAVGSLADGVYTLMTSINGRVIGTFNATDLTGLGGTGTRIEYIDDTVNNDYRVVLVMNPGAVTYEWDAEGGVANDAERDWSLSSPFSVNWTGDKEPTCANNAFVSGGQTAVVARAGEAANNLYVGTTAGPTPALKTPPIGTVYQIGGSMKVCDELILGAFNNAAHGTYDITAGQLYVDDRLLVGSDYGGNTVTGELLISGSASNVVIDSENGIFAATGIQRESVMEYNIDRGDWQFHNRAAWKKSGSALWYDSTLNGEASEEGAAVQLVSNNASGPELHLSFDYDVSAGDTLYAHLWGYTGTVVTPDQRVVGLNTFPNGAVGNQETSSTELDAFNLSDGATSGFGGAGTAISGPITGSGTYAVSVDIAGLGIAGVSDLSDLTYLMVAFGKDEDGLAGTNTLDNILLISDSGTAVLANGGLTVPHRAPQTGTVTMTGGYLDVGSSAQGSGSIRLGNGSSARMYVSGDSRVDADSFNVNHHSTTNLLRLSGGEFNVRGGPSVEGSSRLEIHGGSMTIDGQTRINQSPGTGATSTVVMTSGYLDVTDLLQIGYNGHGAFYMSGDAVAIANEVNIPRNAGANTGFLQMNGGTFTARGGFNVANSTGTGIFEFNTGTVHASTFRIGDAAAATGTVTQTGGTLNTTNDYRVGDSGLGTANLYGGTNNVGRDLKLGAASGGRGYLTITSGELDVARDLIIGYTGDATGTGVFHVVGDGASISASNLTMSSTGNAHYKVDLSGGTNAVGISPIIVSNLITVSGTLTVTNTGPIRSDETYLVATSLNETAVSGTFDNVIWQGDVGAVLYSDNQVRIVFNGDEINLIRGTKTNDTVELEWTGAEGKPYDLLYIDARNLTDSLSDQWALLGTTNTLSLDDTAPGGITPLSELTDNMRFYRASKKNQWAPQYSVRSASEEIYVARNIWLHPGDNWVSFPAQPDTNTVEAMFGLDDLPAGMDAETATVINWHARTNNDYTTTMTVMLMDGDPNYWIDVKSLPSLVEANTNLVDLTDACNIQIPDTAAVTNFIFIGRVPTNQLSQAVPGSRSFGLVGVNRPRHMHPSELGLGEGDAVQGNGAFTGGIRPTFSDRIWKWDRASQQVQKTIWYDTRDGTWRFTSSGYPLVPAGYFSPDDGIVVSTRRSSETITFTNRIDLYSPPTQDMNP